MDGASVGPAPRPPARPRLLHLLRLQRGGGGDGLPRVAAALCGGGVWLYTRGQCEGAGVHACMTMFGNTGTVCITMPEYLLEVSASGQVYMHDHVWVYAGSQLYAGISC